MEGKENLTQEEFAQASECCKKLNCSNCPLYEYHYCKEMLKNYLTSK